MVISNFFLFSSILLLVNMNDDPWDDWETAADAGLIDCKKSITTKTSNEIKPNNPIIIHSNDTPSHVDYKPDIKILKRPKDVKLPRDKLLDKPVKAIEEREKDYMEARRKIFESFDQRKKETG
ncbi:hypothetical protein BDB01DRAFT_778340 [Pilobolus umbonatus]|nr:hypothetical protein BDB01DRAFT_778340 [Pilobolus umbonatus]